MRLKLRKKINSLDNGVPQSLNGLRDSFFYGMRKHPMLFVLLLLLLGCTSDPQPSVSILPAECALQDGDVVFRRGGGLTSRMVMAAEGNGAYSHVGIVVDSCGEKMIVHAVPGEPDFDGDPDRVKMELPERFFSSVNAQRGEVCRHVDSLAAKRAARVAIEVYRRHTLFDHDYDDSDTTKMYCTELVVFSYLRAGVPFINITREKVDFIMLHANCVLPTGLLESKQLYSISKF